MRSASTSSLLILLSLFSCSGSQGTQTFIENCQSIQMLYHLGNGERTDWQVRCITPGRPALPTGVHDGTITTGVGKPWE